MDFAFGANSESNLETETKSVYFPISIPKLILFWFSTFGIYPIYWFYKQWKYVKERGSRGDILPFWRGVFFIFFAHSLFRDIEDESEKRNIQKNWEASGAATIFVILTIVIRVVDNINSRIQTLNYADALLIVGLFMQMIPACMVQGTINRLNEDPKGKKNSKIRGVEYLFLIPGLFVWVLAAIGTFLPDTN